MLVHDVTLVLDRSRISSLVDDLRHDADLLDAKLKFIVLDFFDDIKRFISDLLLLFAGSSCVSSLLLLDLSKLDLSKHFFLGKITILILLIRSHEFHLTLLLSSESLVHLE